MILIQNILNGNRVAQETLYDRYKKIIKDFLKCKYGLYYDIDDDVAEVLIKIFFNLNTFDSKKSKLKSWVLSITKNYMIDKWRNNPTLSLTNSSIITTNATSGQYLLVNGSSIGWSDEAIISTSVSNSLSFTANSTYTTGADSEFENCNTICYLSKQISPVDNSLLNMKYVQGYNYCEIGKEFNISSNTVSNRVNYIKTKLKKQNKNIND